MKSEILIADRILRQSLELAEGSDAFLRGANLILSRARAILSKPAANHTPAEGLPSLDRFIFSASDFERLLRFSNENREVGESLLTNGRAPLPNCWIEAAEYGWLIEDEAVTCFHRGGVRDYVAPLFVCPDFWCVSKEKITIQPCFAQLNKEGIGFLGRSLAILTSVITNPRIAVTSRVIRKSNEDATQRAFALRRAQRGRPIFSFNRVEITAPKLCEFRGVLVEVASLAGRRGHMVVGHWRLIDGKLEPYWIWIEGHERGDRELGWIAKERMINIAPIERRGFLSPSFSGFKGQRIKAA